MFTPDQFMRKNQYTVCVNWSLAGLFIDQGWDEEVNQKLFDLFTSICPSCVYTRDIYTPEK